MNPSTIVRVIRTTSASAVAMCGLVVTPPAVAGEYDGESQCRGTLIYQTYFYTDPFDDPDTRIARLEFYYSAAERLTCAKMVHVKASYGKALKTGVYLYASTSQNEQGAQKVSDVGTYKYYAGPIGYHVGPAGGQQRCVTPIGTIVWQGVSRGIVGSRRCFN